jgi:hypothetical protein
VEKSYWLSQQGFEKFNHALSTVYFRRTNHSDAKKKILAIG